MANFISGLISLTIGVVILANVFIATVKNTTQCYGENGTNCWTGAEIALWGLLTLIAIAGMIYGIMNVFGLN